MSGEAAVSVNGEVRPLPATRDEGVHCWRPLLHKRGNRAPTEVQLGVSAFMSSQTFSGSSLETPNSTLDVKAIFFKRFYPIDIHTLHHCCYHDVWSR